MKLHIGTSGFQYPEWKEKFYPADLPLAKMLPYYAGRFDTTEVNYSFRRVPSEKTLTKWDEATPEHFVFSFKAPQKITHFAKLRDCADETAFFFAALQKIQPKLGVILFQLPPTLKCDVPLLADFLPTIPRGPRVAFEFRDPSWFTDEVYAALSAADAALCLAESADLAVPRIRTASFSYLRLRREDYSAKDLADWADFLHENGRHWTRSFVYFKHEDKAVGPGFAADFQKHFQPLETAA